MVFNRRTRRLGAATLVAGALGAAALTAAFPTVAKSAVVAVTTVSCSVTGSNWCISDYRIVATALGRAGQRMALTSEAAGAGIAPRAALPVVPAANATARLQAAPALPPARKSSRGRAFPARARVRASRFAFTLRERRKASLV